MYIRVTPQSFFLFLRKENNDHILTFAKLMCLIGLKAASFKMAMLATGAHEGRNTFGFVVVVEVGTLKAQDMNKSAPVSCSAELGDFIPGCPLAAAPSLPCAVTECPSSLCLALGRKDACGLCRSALPSSVQETSFRTDSAAFRFQEIVQTSRSL